MPSTTLAAGDPIESRCTKCRKITNHIIVAMAEDVPAKVQCNTCSGQHKYRPTTVRKKPAPRRTADPAIAEQQEWLQLQSEIEARAAIAYTMQTTFKVGSVMQHPTFGLGLVQGSPGPQKVEVLFEDGKRKLRCL